MNVFKFATIFFTIGFTIISAFFTAKYGWDTGTGEWEKWFYGALGAFVSGSVAVWCFFTGGFVQRKSKLLALFAGSVALTFICFDMIGNFGNAAYTKGGQTLVANNANKAVKNRETRAAELRQNIKRAQAKPEYKTQGLRGAGFYEATMRQLEGKLVPGSKRTFFKRSKGCTDITKGNSEAFCLEYRAAEQGLRSAEEKERIEIEVSGWQSELSKISDALINEPKETTANIAMTLSFAKAWTGNLEPGEEVAQWADLGQSGALGFISTFGSIVFSIALGWVGIRPDYSKMTPAPPWGDASALPPELHDHRARYQNDYDRHVPDRPATAYSSEQGPTVIVSNSGSDSPPQRLHIGSTDTMAAELDRLDALCAGLARTSAVH